MASESNKRVPAPELLGGTAWFNVKKPLTLKDLKGKMVLLDFWTYGCINCMHIIPDLKKLEKKYPNELVVIGVHSAKFYHEREAENIRQAILRYEIEHPVVADSNFAIWQAYGVRAWPTLILIDPEGYIVGSDTGEGHYEILDKIIGQLIADYRSKKLISDKPLHLSLEKYRFGPGILSFPGKVLAHEETNRLFIADSNHNRIVIADLDGMVLGIAGNGRIGKKDGAFKNASFYHPQGMALDGDNLYVADTKNHLIRKIDIKRKTVKTIAGTGKQAKFMERGGMGTSSPLNSPWDLAFSNGQLYIAMAGTHQIWVMDLETTVFKPFAGSGREGRVDGIIDQCALAQPSGITQGDKRLYFVDSETSSVRYIDIVKNKVKTIVGQDLFVFGDMDGTGKEVRLQHPLGIAIHNDLLYVADTYNHKIKIVNPSDNTCRTFAGNGDAGFLDGKKSMFYEPSGVSFAKNKLYVADTNNHAIRRVDIMTQQVSTLPLRGLEPKPANLTEISSIPPFARIIDLPQVTLKNDADVQLILQVNLPEGYHVNPLVPLSYNVEVNRGIQAKQAGKEVQINNPAFPLIIPLKIDTKAQDFNVKVSATFSYCREDNQGRCYFDAIVWNIPANINKESDNTEILLDYKVMPTAR